MELEYDLLDVEAWPEEIKASPHLEVLASAARLSKDLSELLKAGGETDAALQQAFAQLGAIAPQLPQVTVGVPAAYVSVPWDLRELSALVPASLELSLEQTRPGSDPENYWTASLADRKTEHTGHPSNVLGNLILNYSSEEYGSAWTPNMALARSLLAAFLLAALLEVCPGIRGEKVAGAFV